jgi:hypothetical protein
VPEYKKQHYLPSAYLKYFSVDQSACNRKSKIWRFDGKDARLVPVETQCFGDYFYSKKDPAGAEKTFHALEAAYCRFVDEIKAGREPSRISYGDLFLNMTDFHLRNSAHKNRSSDEGLEAYNVRRNLFFVSLLLCAVTDNSAVNEESFVKSILKHLFDFWRLEIIPAPQPAQFATSDNPSVLATCQTSSSNKAPPVEMIILPLDPRHIAIAFDRRSVAVQNKEATFQDVERLNRLQAQHAENCVYKASPFNVSDSNTLKSIFTVRTKPVCEVTNDGWRSYLIPILHSHFSFMALRPPLM